MMLKQKLDYLSKPELQVASGGLAGTTVKVALDRTFPLEEIILVVDTTAKSDAATGVLTADGLMNIVKNVRLHINDGRQPRTIVNYSGPGLLEYALNTGLNLDAATLGAICEGSKASPDLQNSYKYRLCYRIPLVHPMITEPLRTRMLADVQNHVSDPVLEIEFGASTDIHTTSSYPMAAILCDIVTIRREMPKSLNDKILAEGGFIPFDLVENAGSLGVGVTGEQRWQVPVPGQYAGLLLRHYKGGDPITRADMSSSVTIGSESQWRLETGGILIRQWRNKHLAAINQFSRVLNSPVQASSPNPGLNLAASTLYQDPVTFYLDFLSDGIDPASELGSLLDCNIPAAAGLKMEIVGAVASVATNGSILKYGGHRYFGNLERWQVLK